MKINQYIKENWDSIMHSSFNDDECVVIKCYDDTTEGYGHHHYSGLGVDKDGNFVWCYSSGCSCNGSCGLRHSVDFKTLNVDADHFDPTIDIIDPKTLDFNHLQVSFNDYD